MSGDVQDPLENGSTTIGDDGVAVVVGGVERTGSGSDLVAKRRRWLAGVLVGESRALLTGDLAAPAEATVAPVDADHPASVVASTAAHHVAAVGTARRLATQSTGRPQRTCTRTHERVCALAYLGFREGARFEAPDACRW